MRGSAPLSRWRAAVRGPARVPRAAGRRPSSRGQGTTAGRGAGRDDRGGAEGASRSANGRCRIATVAGRARRRRPRRLGRSEQGAIGVPGAGVARRPGGRRPERALGGFRFGHVFGRSVEARYDHRRRHRRLRGTRANPVQNTARRGGRARAPGRDLGLRSAEAPLLAPGRSLRQEPQHRARERRGSPSRRGCGGGCLHRGRHAGRPSLRLTASRPCFSAWCCLSLLAGGPARVSAAGAPT